MLARIRPRLTYANVVSSLALFVVLGGGAYATIDRKIGTKDIKKGAVSTKKLKKQAVRAGKIAPGSVRAPKIFDGAVITDKLADGAVTSDKLANLAVNTLKLADLAVTSGKVADQAVTTGKVADQAVSTVKIAGQAVTTAKVADNAISTAKVADAQITSPKIAPGAVRTAQLGTLTRRISGFIPVANGAAGSATANCEPGERAISGGGTWGTVTPTVRKLWMKDSFPNINATAWTVRGENDSGAADNLAAFALCLAP